MLSSVTAVLALAMPGTTLDGVWQSRGYGVVIEIHGETATAYDLNSAACLEREHPEKVHELFRDPQLSSDGKRLTAAPAHGLTTLYYDRLKALPPLCTAPRVLDTSNALYNFDVFWSWFDEHYAYFARRGLDWRQIRAEYRSTLTAESTADELRNVLTTILRQFQDAHVTLSGEDFYVNAGITPLVEGWFSEYHRQFPHGTELGPFAKAKVIEYLQPSWNRYLDPGSLRQRSRNVVTARAQGGRTGYIMVSAEADPATAVAELDQAFRDLRNAAGLILDVRINFGGQDTVALALTGLLTSEDRDGFSKCSRAGAGFTPAQRTRIRHRDAAFTGPVVILSAPYNISAGENFLMMAKDFSNVLVVGDRSAGVHSDTLRKPLPNGWQVTISNEAFVAPDGTMYETLGVPPDVLAPYYPEEVRATGVDPLMERALHILSSPRVNELIRVSKRAARGSASLCR